MWDGSTHHDTDRKNNTEIRPGTKGTRKSREREKESRGGKKHLPCFFCCTDGTVKHQEDGLLLRGKKGAGREPVLSNECVLSGRGRRVVFTWAL